ncbi:yemanuclein isoform X2 [Sitodiplosis mosellana]|uniref:yemanuclein isoform X2 n=1 Tax=Sitodiplosis mosellana TaxID=263140 RepID=UPI00244512B2|nr:yemanuclein isoform X2 [Sitodiplosis mosellana]
MSEPKRVTFETISSGSSKNLAADASAKNEKTMRIELKLFEPNANKYPLFNFKTLCQAEKLKEKQKVPLPNGFADPLEEVDHDAEKLAQEFERKYGNGYDENNGFIDDSEAFDEVIPDEMDTDRGGFYINSGPLQFKKLNFSNKASKRALPLSSDDESDSSENSVMLENGNATKKPKIVEKDQIVSTNKEKNNDLAKKDKPPISVNAGETIKDQSAGNKETTVMNMLRQKRDASIREGKISSHSNKGSKSTSSATSDDSSSSESDSSESSSDADPSRHSDEDDFESVKNNGAENKAIDNAPVPVSVPAPAPSVISNKIQINGTSTTSSTSTNNIPQEPDITFFEHLSTNERDSIRRLIDYSKNLKENFIQPETLDLLYEIIKAHQSDSKIHNQIFTYLEHLTPCTKQQMMNEVKDYAIKKSEMDVRTQERILQKEINQIMPAVKERFDQEMKRVEEQRAAHQGSEKPEHTFRNPRRKFHWNDSLKLSVNKLITKWQSLYAQKQIRDQTLEQYTTSYITDKLVPMWPDGWMKLNDIQSHCMPKPKVKESKKPANEVKTSKPLQPTAASAQPSLPISDNMIVHTTEKKKSHKDPTKLIKNANEKPTIPKTDKKHPQHALSASDRSIISPLLPMHISDAFITKSAVTKPSLDTLLSSSSASISTKPKSISSSNGNATNYVRQSDTNLSLEYVSPTKKASDHSIQQLMSSSTSNHSAYVSTIKHQSQLLGHSSYAENPTTSAHSVSNKSTQGSSSKSKFDGPHRPQSTANGSNNNSFLHNNNNNKAIGVQRPLPVDTIDLCDTDEGEPMAKKSKPHKPKKDHNKKSKEGEQRNSVPLPNTVQMLNQLHQPTASLGANASISDEVDHNQIIHDLKK